MKTLAKLIWPLWLAAGVAYTFLVLPPAYGFQSPELARMVALHLPNAYVAVIAAGMAAVFGWRYLTKGRQPIDDAKSASAAALALLFCVLTTVTGSVFAQYQWGTFWNWDPRETSVTVLLLIYVAYFILRGGIEDPDKRGAASAAYVLFAAVMTPLLGYVIPKYMMSLHPTNVKFDAPYRVAIYLCVLPGLLGTMGWLYSLAVRLAKVNLALNAAEAGEA
jgi:heme exporter protein C